MMRFVVALQSFVVTFQCSGSRTRRCALNPRLLQPVNANPLQLVRGEGFPASAAPWFIRRSWAWITFKPGSRPRRAAQKIRGGPGQVRSRPAAARSYPGHAPLDAYSSERERFVPARLKAALERRPLVEPPKGIRPGGGISPFRRRLSAQRIWGRYGL
jgi:hypothetical protein